MARLSNLTPALALVALGFLSAAAAFIVDPIPGGRDSRPLTGSMSASQSAIPSTFVTIISVSSSYPPPQPRTGPTPPFPIPINATNFGPYPTAPGAPLPLCSGPPATYTVSHQDTVAKIATKFNVTTDALEATNAGRVRFWDLLEDGIELVIPPTTCSLYRPSGYSATLTSPPPLASTSIATMYNSSDQSSSHPTTTGPVTAWTVASGDSGSVIASKANVPFFAISSANPSVTWTALSVGQILVIPPSPTALAQVTGSLAVKSFDSRDGMGTPKVMYTEYNGDGSTVQGWPAMSEWLSFNAQWENIKNYIGKRCGDGVLTNLDTETNDLKMSILTVASDTYIDPRFVLATVMQESNGCVRVQTTSDANPNPGLLQSFNGKGTCNHNGTFDTPCPPPVIHRMVIDGVAAPIDGVTIVAALNQAAEMAGVEPAQAHYRAARFYNSGPESLPPETNGDLGSDITAATRCYASDIANRLLGWSNGSTGRSPCTLDKKG
ncbi:hypothetical protein G647_03892 [Cladophialophora carrionii CBS 160.54]|uniref:LysM domain-containing protein n=1 Tax=Cladophialophora carrionii CBS 160.54 TaxID=1279043 RepID=V9DDX1_9EURO|nr:uncharacterized protein G647_03892 [Cladophialophora carrionii CBS 160.54]ETI24523.1 hypothetical protein G647_03892 [Cladophialophora carrionii CBS 160.54]